MRVKELSDYQLHTMLKDKKLDSDLRIITSAEYKQRNFNTRLIEKLDLAYEEANVFHLGNDLPQYEKVLILLIPFFPLLHALIATRHIRRREMKKWRQHWKYLAIGLLIWTVLLIPIAKYVIFNDRM